MLSLRRPTADQLAALTDQLERRPMTAPVDLLDRPTTRWFDDRHRARVGERDDFDAAKSALAAWAMFDQPWTIPPWPPAPIIVGQTVSYSACVLGLWWSYGCRIVEVVDEVDRFGFVYATIDPHAERGAELFEVTRDDEGTWFALHAKSRPGRWFAWPGLPIARRAQARFRSGAASAMNAATDDARLARPC